MPTRITRNSQCLVDVLILDKYQNENLTSVLDLGYSDHFAQIFSLETDKPVTSSVKVFKRNFSLRNIPQFTYFLEKELMHSINKKLILCEDWNINFMKDSERLQELRNLLVMYNLINTVTSPMRITKNTMSLLDIIVTNKQTNDISSTVWHLGYSDHVAQILHINVDRHKQGLVKTRKRQFTKENIEEFKYLLQK
jgi:hypothetical protein